MSVKDYYNKSYNDVIETGAVGYVASIYHKMLESGHKRKFETVLEIGAGTALHFKYVRHEFGNIFRPIFETRGINSKKFLIPGISLRY